LARDESVAWAIEELAMTHLLWVTSAAGLCLQWIVVHLGGYQLAPEWQTLSAGLAIFGASFMLSWAAELAQFDIPQALALAFLALIAVLPKCAVDMNFAWMAGKDPKYTAFATANMTGANRLLIGVGWAAVVFAFWLKTRQRTVKLDPEHRIEVYYLGLATLYSFSIPFKGRLDLFEAVVFIAIGVFYMRSAAQAAHVEPELESPTETIAAWGAGMRRAIT
jgi:cation:H+ antiporter